MDWKWWHLQIETAYHQIREDRVSKNGRAAACPSIPEMVVTWNGVSEVRPPPSSIFLSHSSLFHFLTQNRSKEWATVCGKSMLLSPSVASTVAHQWNMNDSEDGRVQQLCSLGKNGPRFWGLREGSQGASSSLSLPRMWLMLYPLRWGTPDNQRHQILHQRLQIRTTLCPQKSCR